MAPGREPQLPVWYAAHAELSDLFKHSETRHRTFLTVVKDQNQIDAIVNATQEVIGDLEKENTGLLFVIPVSQVYGESKLG